MVSPGRADEIPKKAELTLHICPDYSRQVIYMSNEQPSPACKTVIAMTTYFSSKLPIQEQTLKVFSILAVRQQRHLSRDNQLNACTSPSWL